MRDYVDSPGNAGVQFVESGLHSRSLNNRPGCFPPEPFDDLPSPDVLGNTPRVLNRIVYRQDDWNVAFARRKDRPSRVLNMPLLDVQYFGREALENPTNRETGAQNTWVSQPG